MSENIKKYRKLNNMSQDELAEKLEVTRQSISLWETGQTQPSLDNIVALAKLFNITTDDLLKDDSEKPVVTESTDAPSDKPKNNTNILIACVIIGAVLLILLVLWKGGILTDSTPDYDVEVSVNAAPDNNEKAEQPPEMPSDDKSVVTDTPQEIYTPVTEKIDLFGYLKSFVIENGIINGDYCYYSNSADNYGGYEYENFSLYYWGDTDKIEFCVHEVIDDTFSINFYIYVPKTNNGKYEYISSYYYRDTGEPLYQAEGIITASEFTKNYPLNCTEYIGSTDIQNDFMEVSRQGICSVIEYLKQFVTVEKLECSFSDFGFVNF